MTPEELKAIRERCEKATEGPWKYRSEGDEGKGCHWIQTADEMKEVLLTYHWDDQKEFVDIALLDGWGNELEPLDLQFIAHARSDIPELLDEIERLQSEIASLLS